MSGSIESVIQGSVVQGVSTRRVGQNQTPIWDVEIDGRKWSTFKAELGNAADQLAGKTVDVKVEITENTKGDKTFTNYNLIAIRPSKTSVSTDAGRAAVAAAEAQQAISYTDYKSLEGEKQVSIHRQVAGKVAGAISSDAGEFWANIEAIFNYFQTGEVPASFRPQVPTRSEPEPEWGPSTSEEDDIPFD